MSLVVISREDVEVNFEMLCEALEEGCGCGEIGNASRCILLTEYIALCELREMALRAVASNPRCADSYTGSEPK